MKLTPAAFETVSAALEDAFIDPSDFEQIARCRGEKLADIVSSRSPLPAIILATIESAEAQDAVEQLIECAKKQNPHNRLLAAVTVDDLIPADAPQEVVEGREGAPDFKQRLVATLSQFDESGMGVLAAHELSKLLEKASDDEAQTLYLVLVGMVRSDRRPEVLGELSKVFATALRRQIGEQRPAGLDLELARVRLPRAVLSDLDLHEADLAFADLTHADISNTNLWRSRAYGVNASNANLTKANLEEARWQSGIARRARFQDCRMVSVFLKDADLGDASFQGSRLQGAHFERANLEGAHFEGANVSDATFWNASIDEAAAKSLSQAANWEKARFDSVAGKLISSFASDGG